MVTGEHVNVVTTRRQAKLKPLFAPVFDVQDVAINNSAISAEVPHSYTFHDYNCTDNTAHHDVYDDGDYDCNMPSDDGADDVDKNDVYQTAFCLLYTSPSPRDGLLSRMPSSA